MKVLTFLVLALVLTATTGIFITCNFGIGSVDITGNLYRCIVTSASISGNATHITGYNGTHLPGNSSANVQMIYFTTGCLNRFNFTTVPRGFTSFFPNIIALYFLECEIHTIFSDDLREYSDFKHFVLRGGNITRVPGDYFALAPNMKFINFGVNKIQHVGEGLLDDLSFLEGAYFWGNICIDKSANNPAQIHALIEALRQNCTDIETQPTTLSTTKMTTTSTSTSTLFTTTTQPPKCEFDDLEDFVCSLDEENQFLSDQLKLHEDKLKIQDEQLQDHENDIKTLKENVEELAVKVLELSSRPCSC